MGQRVIFKVFGHGVLNGNYKIDIEKEMDAELAYKLRSKNNLIQFVKQECPGVKIKENTLDYRINPIKETAQSKSSSQQSSDSNSKTMGNGVSSIIGGFISGAIVSALNSESEADASYNAEKEKQKVDLEYYKKQKEDEHKQNIKETKNRIKQEKIERAKLELENGGSKILYVIKRFWFALDKVWKKILFFYLLLMVLIFAADFFTQWSDKKELETINNRFIEIVKQAEIEISNKNINSLEISVTELKKIINETNVKNEFLLDYESKLKEDWNFKLNKLEANIKKSKQKRK